MIDMCSDERYDNECPPNSDCYMEQPGVTNCRCHSGYVRGDGGCYGNIMQVRKSHLLNHYVTSEDKCTKIHNSEIKVLK